MTGVTFYLPRFTPFMERSSVQRRIRDRMADEFPDVSVAVVFTEPTLVPFVDADTVSDDQLAALRRIAAIAGRIPR
jgi:hypothetical protein